MHGVEIHILGSIGLTISFESLLSSHGPLDPTSIIWTIVAIRHAVYPHKSALRRILAQILGLVILVGEFVEGIPWKCLAQIREWEFLLRILCVSEYDPGRMLVRRIIRRETGQIRQTLTGHEILMKMVEHRFRSSDIILAI